MPYYTTTGHCKMFGLLGSDRAVRGRVMQSLQSAVPSNSAPSASHRSPRKRIPGLPWKCLHSLLIGMRQAAITERPGRPYHQIPAGLVLGNAAQQARTSDSSAAPPAASPGEGRLAA